MITPAVIERPVASGSLPKSIDCTDPLFVWREVRDPGELAMEMGASRPPFPSCRWSSVRSLCSFRPKNDLPADVCLDLSLADEEVGILAGVVG